MIPVPSWKAAREDVGKGRSHSREDRIRGGLRLGKRGKRHLSLLIRLRLRLRARALARRPCDSCPVVALLVIHVRVSLRLHDIAQGLIYIATCDRILIHKLLCHCSQALAVRWVQER